MKNQILKGVWAASLVGALAVLAIPAEAAEISGKIPFSFVVNGKTLPPGTYHVSTSANQALLVRGYDAGVFAMANSMESRDSDAKLVFHKYGDQYILRQVWLGNGRGRQLPETRQERELIQTARNGGKLASAFERVVIQGF
jgi:hypothetical protein